MAGMGTECQSIRTPASLHHKLLCDPESVFFTGIVGMILFKWLRLVSAIPGTNISFINEGDIRIYP